MSHDEVRDELIKRDKNFRLLWEEHQDCERRLQELNQKGQRSHDEDSQAKQIKVHKLHLKDRMEQLIKSHEAAAS